MQGATPDISRYFFSFKFQSTHPCRVRPSLSSGKHVSKYFNPRTRAGCDAHWLCATTKPKNFNPRTRAGCDAVFSVGLRENSNFNPRTRAGCDGLTASAKNVAILFQSTHPCRVRPLFPRKRTPCGNFNPRTRAGCDQPVLVSVYNIILFQSTHPCRVRPDFRFACYY